MSLLRYAVPVAIVTGVLTAPSPGPTAMAEPTRVGRGGFEVTSGDVEALPGDRLRIEVPEVRAVLRGSTAPVAEIHFRYLGPTVAAKPLASGELRRQIGLKLRAQDTCNVLYVMWHIQPDAGIAVSVKRNRGQHTHAECGARGYTTIRGMRRAPAPIIVPGSWHTLRAALREVALTVWSDGVVVWEGTIPANLLDFDGPVGLRSDNGRFEIEYAVGE